MFQILNLSGIYRCERTIWVDEINTNFTGKICTQLVHNCHLFVLFLTSVTYFRKIKCLGSSAVANAFLKINDHFHSESGIPKWVLSSFCTFSWFHNAVFLTLNLLTPIHFALTLALTRKWLCFIPTLWNHLSRLSLTLSGGGYGDGEAAADKSELQWFLEEKNH